MKNLFYFLSIIFLILGFQKVYPEKLKSEEITPDDTQKNSVFLGVSFGYDVKETYEALSLYNCKFVNADEYLKTSNVKLLLINTYRRFIHPPWEKWERFYMPSIILFESYVEAEFEFLDGKLYEIEVHFSPLFTSKTASLIDKIDKKLIEKYFFEKREESISIPGAYTLIYEKNNVTVHLWINLRNINEPVVIASFQDEIQKAIRDQNNNKIEFEIF